ncbi:MAG: M15 family metallopeptidase [Oscillospiraceae bacterium]|nr:M15 family metallopeptidase [Oscillospiraceae bacterium]
MKKRILAGLLAALLMAVCVLAIPAPAASAEEPQAEETVVEEESAEEAKPSLPPVSSEKPTVPEITDPLPDVDIHSWEFTLCNSYNSRGWLTCERGNLEGIGIDERIREAAATLMADARAAGYTIYIARAYLNTEWLENMYLTTFWVSRDDPILTARSFQAPGVSEHQTGLSIDFTDTIAHAANYEFQFEDPEIFDSELYAWLMEHCADYGFVFRYPAEKAPWYGTPCTHAHFRYVGVQAAKFMTEHDLCLEEFISLYDPDAVYVPDHGRLA